MADVGYSLVDIPKGHFSVVIVNCGSNDLCRLDRTPELVADNLLSLARFLLRFKGVDRVVIFELLPRLQTNRHFEVSLPDFNNRVHMVNASLKSYCEMSHCLLASRIQNHVTQILQTRWHPPERPWNAAFSQQCQQSSVGGIETCSVNS